jgi:hypothetical protein
VDQMAGDGVWTGEVKVHLTAPGSYSARIAAEDSHRRISYSQTFTLTAE